MRRAVTAWCAVVFGGLYLAAAIALGSPPAADAGGQVSTWFGAHEHRVRLAVWFLVVGLPFFSVASAAIRQRLPEVLRDIFFAGAIAFVVETAIQCWLWGALAFAPSPTIAGASVVYTVALFWGPVLTSATMTMLVPLAIAGLRYGWPRWQGVLAALAAIEQAIETFTVFGHHGFMAPGGAMNLEVGAGMTALALFAAVAAVALGRAPVADEATS